MKMINRIWGKVEKPKTQLRKGDPLLHTYLTSLFSLVLCVVMFCGTSLAWFSSEVESGNNEIYVGVLKVDMEHKVQIAGTDGNKNIVWNSLSSPEAAPVFGEDILWEPNYTAIETLRVVNQGELAFRYKVYLSMENMTDEQKNILNGSLGEYISVYIYEGSMNEKPVSFQALQEDQNWQCKGSLKEVMTQRVLLTKGEIRDVTKLDENGNVVPKTETTQEFTIALNLSKDAESSIMGQKLEKVGIKLEAYQYTYEEDAFGPAYDSGLEEVVVDAAALKTDENGNVVLNLKEQTTE